MKGCCLEQRSRHFIQTWVPLLLLAALFFYGLTALPPVSETDPTFHVASRFLENGTAETGLPNSFSAVFLDYRGFDLMLLSLLGIVLALIATLFCVVEDIKIKAIDRALFFVALLSSFLLMSLGWLGVNKGSNWMDYEGWVGLGFSAARSHGALIALVLTVITLSASLIEGWRLWSLGKEKRFGHR